MIPATQAYRDAIGSTERAISIYMAIGYNIDNTSADDLVSASFDGLAMSNRAQLTDANYTLTPGLATFEGDGIPTATAQRMRAPPISPATVPTEAGVWSSDISDADGNLDWTIVLGFGGVHRSALTLFTSDVHILEATIVYTKEGQETYREDVENTSPNLSIADAAEYDTITIEVKRVDQPYRHLRLVEVEFGTSLTLNRSALTGRVTYIAERDRTGASMPLYELDFTAINDGWIYDYDAPQDEDRSLALGRPVMLSYSIETESGPYTIPCGRFVIRDIEVRDTLANITANDPRALLDDVSEPWTIPTSKSIATALGEVLEDMGIAHRMEEGLYSLYPVREIAFQGDTTYLDDIFQICQFFGIEMVPSYDGILDVHTVTVPDEYGDVTTGRMYTWPEKRTEFNPYNIVTVYYGDGVQKVTRDLRTSSRQTPFQLTVHNDLIVTETEAATVADRLVSTMYDTELIVEWTGDPSLEVGDNVGFPGRWTDAVPRYVSYQALTFEGGLKAETRCIL